jgi:hypothetical protein
MPTTDKPLTVAEAAHRLGLSVRTVRRLFESERGVLLLTRPERVGYKKRYRSMRIPREVFERVLRRLAVA